MCCSCSLPLADAQSYNDTIEGMSYHPPEYFYNWDFSNLPDSNVAPLHMAASVYDGMWYLCLNRLLADCRHHYYRRLFHYHYTEWPMQIIGVAGSFAAMHLWDRDSNNRYIIYGDPYYGDGSSPFIDTPAVPEQVLVYDAFPDTFLFKASCQINRIDTHRYMSLHVDDTNHDFFHLFPYDTCIAYAQRDKEVVVPIYECYFDEPVWVEDSFYVGVTKNSLSACDEYNFGVPKYVFITRWIHARNSNKPSCPIMPEQLFRQDELIDNGYPSLPPIQYRCQYSHPILFPIIVPDTAEDCRPVENVEVVSVDSGSAQIAWSAYANHESWEVNYCEEGVAVDSGTVVTCSVPTVVLTGLADDVHYRVYVRAVCSHHDSTYHSEWSDGVEVFHESPHEEPEGIAEAGRIARFTSLLPNPASGTVQVMSSYRMRRIEVYDHTGRKVMEREAEGATAAFSVGQWARGVYVVLVHSEQGIAAKRLVVQ